MTPFDINDEQRLRIQLQEVDGEPALSATVSLELFDEASPLTGPATLTYPTTHLGNGVYEAVIPAGSLTSTGLWNQVWKSTLGGEAVELALPLQASDGGMFTSAPQGTAPANSLVEVSISNLRGVSGSILKSLNLHYMVEPAPFYSSIRTVLLVASGFLKSIDDITVGLAILEASLEADVLTFGKDTKNKLYLHARREYVTYKAACMLARNALASGGLLKKKVLSDFEVEYDTGGLGRALGPLCDRAHEWEDQLKTTGRRRASAGPQGVIKGELDPDRPVIGRTWHPTTGPRTGVGNIRTRRRGQRRAKKDFRRRH